MKNSEDPAEEAEFWDDIPDDILNHLGKGQPLPGPNGNASLTSKLMSLLQWFVLGMPFWQANCKICDNGLEWLLHFMFQVLHLLGVTCRC